MAARLPDPREYLPTVAACDGPALRYLTLAAARFCAFVEDIVKLAREFDSRADFLMVYIAEAHAADEWPVGNRTMTTRFRLGLALAVSLT